MTEEEEHRVIESGVLKPINGEQLNYALFFYLSIGWGCRGGMFSYLNPQHVKKETIKGVQFLVYNTCVDKNHQNGLKEADIPPDLKIMENIHDENW
jgi:hypothetical protein